jgi:hypothetical protein
MITEAEIAKKEVRALATPVPQRFAFATGRDVVLVLI